MTATAFLYLLPYMAIGAGFVVLHNAWAATLLYHGVILGMWVWKRPALRWESRPCAALRWSLIGMCALCLPAIVGLWPWLILPGIDLSAAMEAYGLSGAWWWIFVGYIALVHPVLEEVYWRGLAPDYWASDVAFAGFHVILVAPFLQSWWIVAVVFVLIGAGWVWRWSVRHTGGLGTACITHAIADLCIMISLLILR